MDFLVAVEVGDEKSAYGVVVPALPGCFSAGDTYEEAMANAREAIELHVESLLDAGEVIPQVDNEALIRDARASKDMAGWIMGFVHVDPEALDETVERVNLSLPKRVLHAIDKAAEQAKMSRSGFLAEAGLKAAARR